MTDGMQCLQVDVGSGLPWPSLSNTPPKGRSDSISEKINDLSVCPPESLGPSRSCMKDPLDACLESRVGQSLGKHVGKLLGCVHLDQTHLAVLDDFIAKCLLMSMQTRSRPPTTWFPHLMHAVLSSYTGVTGSCGNPILLANC